MKTAYRLALIAGATSAIIAMSQQASAQALTRDAIRDALQNRGNSADLIPEAAMPGAAMPGDIAPGAAAPGAVAPDAGAASSAGANAANSRQNAAIESRPSVDLAILFGYNSAVIEPGSVLQLMELGAALASPELADNRFLVAGHTDAKGSDEYNRSLSEKRAAAVRTFLVENFAIPADRLIAVGFGETQPSNPADPDSPENRRVQIVNAGG